MFATYRAGVGLVPKSKIIYEGMLQEALQNSTDIFIKLQVVDTTTPEGKFYLNQCIALQDSKMINFLVSTTRKNSSV